MSPVFHENMSRMDSDDLSEKLRAWCVEPELSPAFQRGVWQRIASRNEADSEEPIEEVHRRARGVSQYHGGIRLPYGRADLA